MKQLKKHIVKRRERIGDLQERIAVMKREHLWIQRALELELEREIQALTTLGVRACPC